MADRTVVVRLTAIVADYEAGMGRAAASTRALVTEANTASMSGTAALRQLSTGALLLGGALVAGFGAGIHAAMSFQDAMAGVATTVHGTPAQLDSIATGLRNMAMHMPVTREGLAGIAEEGGRIGVSAGNILAFTDTVVKLGADTDLSTQQAAQSLERLASLTGTPQQAFANLGATIVDLGNKTAASETQIVQNALNIAGAGHAVGLTAPELLGFGAAIASLGPAGQGASLGVTKMFTGISDAVNGSGKNLSAWAKLAGMSVTQFRDSFQRDALGTILAVFDGMHKLSQEGQGELLAALDSVGMGGARGARSIAAMAAQNDVLHRSIGSANGAYAQNNALNQEASIRWATASAQMKIAENQLSDIAVTFGNDVLPLFTEGIRIVGDFATGIGHVTSAMSELPRPIQDVVLGEGLVVAGSLLLIGTLGKIAGAVIKARDAWLSLKGAQAAGAAGDVGAAGAQAAGASAGAGALGGEAVGGGVAASGLSGLASTSVIAPALLAALPVIAAVGAGLLTSRNATQQNKKAVDEWSTALQGFGTVAVPGMGPVIGAFKGAYDWGSKGATSAKDMTSALGPAAKVTADVATAQQNLLDAVKKYGPTSAQAHAAAIAYNTALGQQSSLQTGVAQALASVTGKQQQSTALTRSQANAISLLSSTSGLSVVRIAQLGQQGALTKDQLHALGMTADQATSFFTTGAGAALALEGGLSGIAAGSVAARLQLGALVNTAMNLQALQFGAQGAQLGALGAIDQVQQAYGEQSGGGGGGGGAAKTQMDLLQTAREIPDALRKVQDASDHLVDAQNAVQDALNRVHDTALQERQALAQLSDATEAQHTAAANEARAEQTLANVLHGVAENTRAARTAKREATDADLDAREAALGVTSAQEKLADATTAVHDAQVLHGSDSKVYRDALDAQSQAEIDLTRARERAGDTAGTAKTAQQQYNEVIHGSAPGSARAKQAEDDLKNARKTLRDANIQLVTAEDGVRDAHLAEQRAAIDLGRTQRDLTRAWEDASRAQQDLTATTYDLKHATDAGGGSAGSFRDKILDEKNAVLAAKQAVSNHATIMADLSGATRGSARWNAAYVKTLKEDLVPIFSKFGPDNPLTQWVQGQISWWQQLNAQTNEYLQQLKIASQPQELKGPGGASIRFARGQLDVTGPKTASGGYFPSRPGGYQRTVGEAGDEAVIPLSDPARASAIMQEARPTWFGARAAPPADFSPVVNEIVNLRSDLRVLERNVFHIDAPIHTLDPVAAGRAMWDEADRRLAIG